MLNLLLIQMWEGYNSEDSEEEECEVSDNELRLIWNRRARGGSSGGFDIMNLHMLHVNGNYHCGDTPQYQDASQKRLK